MAAGFTTWTVLPHKPIQKLAENLWHVEGTMPSGTIRRAMAVVRLGDGRLLLHNAIALDENEMGEIDAFGEVAGILVPNAFHRQDAFIMKHRYPNAKVYCPAGAKGGVAKAVATDGTYADAPSDASVRVRHLDGFPGEGVVEVTSNDGVSAIFCDAVMNMSPQMKFPFSLLLAPLGRAAVPRATRWFFVKNKASFKADIERIAATDGFRRILVGHGDNVEENAAEALRVAAGDCG